jgi:8-oxo-dGTP pyrophosphatase MutT (NUDIX family)
MRKNFGAVHIIIRRGDELLLVLRSHTGYEDGNYCLPSGHVEEGESFSHAAVREAREEVGLELDQNEVGFIYLQHRLAANELGEPEVWIDAFFEAGDWHGKPSNAEPDKHAEIAWCYPDDLPENIMTSHRYALERIVEGHVYGEFGWKEGQTMPPGGNIGQTL